MNERLKLILFSLLLLMGVVIYTFIGTFEAIIFAIFTSGLFWINDNRGKILGRFNQNLEEKLVISTSIPKVTFADVAGIDEVVDDAKEVVDFLKNPNKYLKLGARMPKGVLLIGPPGVGKTFLARAIAGEAKVPFDEVSGSSFVNKYVGVGADNIRELFKKKGPRIIFIDEIDALGIRSSSRGTGGDMEYDQTINEFLSQMDGFKGNKGIVVIGATNRPEKLNEAILRPGRFDRKITLKRPDLTGRQAILKVHTKNKPLAEDVDIKQIARGIPGFSGADIENLTNEAAIFAASENKERVENEDFQKAKERILIGLARKSRILTEKQKEIIAYHETGHALIALLLRETPPTKISIISRGETLGVTMIESQEDQDNPSKEFLLNQLRILLGGRAAETLALNTETTGAINDFERATEIASAMVCRFGMSPLGPINYAKLSSNIQLGLSEDTKNKIDAETKQIIDSALKNVSEILALNRKSLDAVSVALIEKETLNKEEIEELIKESRQ